MASRPVWKGQLRLSLVSIPVEMYSATQTGARVKFRQIHEPSGKPVHYQKVVSDIGPVDVDEIFKGYEYKKDEYVLIDPEEVDAIKLETLHYADEIKSADPLFAEVKDEKVNKDLLGRKSKKVTADDSETRHPADNVVDLMAALRASLKKGGSKKVVTPREKTSREKPSREKPSREKPSGKRAAEST